MVVVWFHQLTVELLTSDWKILVSESKLPPSTPNRREVDPQTLIRVFY